MRLRRSRYQVCCLRHRTSEACKFLTKHPRTHRPATYATVFFSIPMRSQQRNEDESQVGGQQTYVGGVLLHRGTAIVILLMVLITTHKVTRRHLSRYWVLGRFSPGPSQKYDMRGSAPVGLLGLARAPVIQVLYVRLFVPLTYSCLCYGRAMRGRTQIQLVKLTFSTYRCPHVRFQASFKSTKSTMSCKRRSGVGGYCRMPGVRPGLSIDVFKVPQILPNVFDHTLLSSWSVSD